MKNILLSFLLILSIGITSFHHHSDGTQHSDCPICVFQINDVSDDVKLNNFELSYLEFPKDRPQKSLSSFVILLIKSEKARSPPQNS